MESDIVLKAAKFLSSHLTLLANSNSTRKDAQNRLTFNVKDNRQYV